MHNITVKYYAVLIVALCACLSTSDSDFTSGTTITIEPPGPVSCIDFTDIIVNDDIGLEGYESFTLFIDDTPAMSMVTITEDDSESIILYKRRNSITLSLNYFRCVYWVQPIILHCVRGRHYELDYSESWRC